MIYLIADVRIPSACLLGTAAAWSAIAVVPTLIARLIRRWRQPTAEQRAKRLTLIGFELGRQLDTLRDLYYAISQA